MNYYNFQNELLKAAHGRDAKNKLFRATYSEANESVILCDGYKLEIIPKEYLYLNVETVFKNQSPTNMSRVLDDFKTKTVTRHEEGKFWNNKQIIVFNFADKDEEIWVDVKLLKDFDLKNSTFKGTHKEAPLFIYENEKIVGIVMPVKH